MRSTDRHPRFEQVLTNLLDNAAKYSAPGTPIAVSVRALPAEVEVAVRDTGPGIPDADLPRLFDRFFQSRRAREQKSGLGLGLFISQELARAHGGRLAVESRIGEGSKFSIVLPRHA